MAKVQNFAGISPNLPFTEYNFYDLYRQTFENSELGKIKANLPLREMAENFGWSDKQEYETEGWTQIVLHTGRESSTYVPEDVHRSELSEAAGTAEREHPLPDIL